MRQRAPGTGPEERVRLDYTGPHGRCTPKMNAVWSGGHWLCPEVVTLLPMPPWDTELQDTSLLPEFAVQL